ncbi:TetR family transcriptional regulator [Tamaricihabitans halophyticus]|uniref:TetR family transcriptional regulator n=1 Tax=Tamaricihabitans halophyticus TaxID=1262583 RepID=A0A4R2R2T9_9PSEU|nr:TetR/AcrR family transcriptional regulator [Tamaricihabitans halophyticus]TCP57080.1 TetR family transcriptional regulator [Tamaricihabitans halophyticus]
MLAGSKLFRRNGYTGTGMKQIVAEASAPFGSLYHFFPGGKEDLGDQVIRNSGRLYGQLVDAFFDPAPDPETAVRDAFAGAATTLRETDFADACPIATIALEVSSTNENLRRACAEVFEEWIGTLAARFSAAGIAQDRARELAVSLICGLEGAFVLSRALRDTKPVEIAGASAAAEVRAALAAGL